VRASGKDNTTSRTLPVAADAALADVSPDVMKAFLEGEVESPQGCVRVARDATGSLFMLMLPLLEEPVVRLLTPLKGPRSPPRRHPPCAMALRGLRRPVAVTS
jgi:hypothetical protein